MAELPENRRRRSSTTSSDVPLDFEFQIAGQDAGRCNYPGHSDRNTPGETATSGKSNSSSGQLKKASRQNDELGVLLAKFFDEKIPPKKKMMELYNLKFEPENLDFRTGAVYSHAVYEVPAYVQDEPPLQIVMLIVGIRGDVQSFVAIGKHLQRFPVGCPVGKI